MTARNYIMINAMIAVIPVLTALMFYIIMAVKEAFDDERNGVSNHECNF